MLIIKNLHLIENLKAFYFVKIEHMRIYHMCCTLLPVYIVICADSVGSFRKRLLALASGWGSMWTMTQVLSLNGAFFLIQFISGLHLNTTRPAHCMCGKTIPPVKPPAKAGAGSFGLPVVYSRCRNLFKFEIFVSSVLTVAMLSSDVYKREY